MANANNRTLYTNYLKRIQRCGMELPCLACGEKKKPSQFKQHLETVHRHLENTCCWCLKYSWPAHEKTQHAKHLLDCFNRLLLNFKVSSKGPESSNTVDLNLFQIRLGRMSKCRYICPWQNFSCSKQLKPGEMEKHFRLEHSPFDPTVSCVWCEGAFSWPRGQKNQNVNHLKICFENYCKKERELRNMETASCSHDSTQRAPLPPSEHEKFIAAHFLNYDFYQYVKNLLGREKVLPNFKEAYEAVIEMYQSCPWFPSSHAVRNKIEYDNVVEIPRFFIDCFKIMHHVSEDDDGAYQENDDEDEIGKEMAGASATWYHVMISAYAFENFIQAVKAFGEEKVFALPFWCWCDGGHYKKAIFRHHRHMILVVENGRDFKTKCWNKLSRKVHNKQYQKKNAVEEEVILQEPLPDGFYFGRSKMIKTWLHLANTIRYVSLPQSGCRYHFEKLSGKENENKMEMLEKIPRRNIKSQRHYFMGSGWHPMQMLCLALIAGRNGLYAVLHQENKFKSKSLSAKYIFRWPPNQKNAPWYVRLGDLIEEREIVLPVKKCWRPVRVMSANERSNKKDQAFLYLMNGDKLLFEKDDSLESLSDDEWSHVQKEGGNNFYNAIADYHWKLSRLQQTIFNTAQKMKELNNKEWELKLKERDAEWELKLKERDAEWELKLKERDAEWELKLKERDAEWELKLKERDVEWELKLKERDAEFKEKIESIKKQTSSKQKLSNKYKPNECPLVNVNNYVSYKRE